MTALPEFDPAQPLPPGITVLEASAGTGKTHAVASIVLAEVARGRPIEEILVVTFTRKATGTLRERVWQRLVAAVDALAPGAPDPHDDLLAHLRSGSATEVGQRRERLQQAMAAFDTATIATTHGFCQQVLTGLGVAGDADRELAIVEDVAELVADAVDDLFVRRFHAGGEVLFTRDTARAIARTVIANPDATIAPVRGGSEEARLRRRFAVTLRARIDDQKRQGRLLTYDDLLSRLVSSIEDPDRGSIVRAALRRRFTAVVVDEFQDTDAVQWRIFREAFAAPPHHLVLVGDPKQAIYAFRGGDIDAYLAAVEETSTTLGLATSWRSDQPLLDGFDAYFGGAQLGDPKIRHRPLRARPGAERARIHGPAVAAPFAVRILDRSGGAVPTGPRPVLKDLARRLIADDVARQTAALLDGSTVVTRTGADGAAVEERTLDAGDVAVLVRTHRYAEEVRRALVAAGVPAVVHGEGKVLATPAAHAWLALLRALENPSYSARVHAAAIGPFVGWDASRLALASEDEWDALDEQMREWAGALRTHGVNGLLRAVEASRGLTARLLGQDGGERLLSDLRHVGELLHAELVARPGSAATLAGWLADRIHDRVRNRTAGDAEHPVDDDRRRLESDAAAVTIQTIHGAKGLEFPVVLLPSLWEGPWTPPDDPPVFHDADGRRALAVGGPDDLDHGDHEQQARAERDAEELRLLYVALTRAEHHVVVWWASGSDGATSPFARMLLGRDDATGAVTANLRRVPDEPEIRAALAAVAARAAAAGSPGAISVDDVDPAATARPRPTAPPGADHLALATFDRTFDRHWTRTSYSGLVAAAHDPGPSRVAVLEVVEVDEGAKVDEPDDEWSDRPLADDPLAVVVPLSDLPGGARVGTLVHEVLEHVDFAAADLTAVLAEQLVTAGAERLLPGSVGLLVAGVEAALRTPLGPAFGERPLASIARHDRLDELAFDLPLAGGDQPAGAVTMQAIAAVFATELAADDPLAGYHERLLDPALAATVRGFLNGSIDLVTRIDGRYVLVDYKTNHLGPRGEPLTAWHYRPEALADAMADAHYPLQASLYAVALHRYLRWRVAGYDPATHLGGAAYLFLRGMTGPDVPRPGGQPCGVFTWQPPASFVTAFSGLLDRGAP